MESRIFRGQRVLGYVCNAVPVQTRYIKKHRDTFVITVVGKRFHTYSASKLHLYSTSEVHPTDITCLAADSRFVYTSCKDDVRIFKRGVEPDFIHKISNVRLLLPFGEFVVAVTDNTLISFARESGEVYLEIPFHEDSFEISCLLHPATYVNKILLASKQGSLELWNVNSASKVYEFSGWGHAVVCLEQSPALDILGIGLQNGDIILHNIKKDVTLLKFCQDWGMVTGIAFRTDGPPLMITGSHLGHLAVWNLETRRLVAQKDNAHCGAVTGLRSFPTEPLLVTSSPDNSLRIWIMDDEVSGVRLLKFKEGHTEPPIHIRFYGDSGATILSAGKDSCIRSFSLEAEFLNFSLGKASFNRKLAKKIGVARDEMVMPPVSSFYAEPAREGEWDNIVAIHEGTREVTTWSYHRRTKGSYKLIHERFKKNLKVLPTNCRRGSTFVKNLSLGFFIQSAVITICGNFCIIGYNTGHVDRFNMQSGIHRMTYGNPTAHEGPVAAVAPDSLNQQVLTAGGKHIKFWNFKSGELLMDLDIPSPVDSMQTYRENSLAAVGLRDFSLIVLDLDMRSIIRTFVGHTNIITDIAFSPDSRWLVSASSDSSIRVWDLSSAHLVDSFRVASPCVSLTFSPTGEHLATAHVDDLGIFLWTNKTVYTPISLTAIPPNAEPIMLTLPGTVSATDNVIPVDEEMVDVKYTSPDQLAESFLTLSLLPDYRWKNLARQDVIRERNKPKEALKLPEKAPFFLPTIPGLEPKFDLSNKDADMESKETQRTNIQSRLRNSSTFYEALAAPKTTQSEHLKAFFILSELSPAQVEMELRKLSPENGGSLEMLEQFVRSITVAMEDGKHQELVQSYLELFLKLHLVELSEEGANKKFAELMTPLRDKVCGNVKRVENLLDQSLNIVMFLKHVAL